MKKWLPDQRSKHTVKNNTNVLDLKVLMASTGNPILLQWLC